MRKCDIEQIGGRSWSTNVTCWSMNIYRIALLYFPTDMKNVESVFITYFTGKKKFKSVNEISLHQTLTLRL